MSADVMAPEEPLRRPPAAPGPERGRTRPRILFFHAHPDDEAIFTGGTMALLAAMGWSVTLVVATSGQLGRRLAGADDIGRTREDETRAACQLLGVDRVEFLRYRDSGLPGDRANHDPAAFVQAEVDEAAGRVASIAADQQVSDLVVYDAGGIYGHPDHVQVHRVGTQAARWAGVTTIYESTVDGEYLRARPGRHLVSAAHQSITENVPLGVASTLVSTVVDVGAHLECKRRAITAHRSQVPGSSAVATMATAAFGMVYGLEWYIRRGPAGALDGVASARDAPGARSAA